MFYSVKKYIHFWTHATNKHGVHSPFVYNFIVNGLNKRNNANLLKEIKAFKAELSHNKNSIRITDFGAGSRVFKSTKRPINKIAKNAGIASKKIKLLLKISTYFNFKSILEIGTSLGIGTFALAVGNPNAKITTLEGCPETLDVAKKLLSKHHKLNIKYVLGDFKNTIDSVLTQPYDLIYFDGNHQKEATITYFEKCLKVAHNDSIFIFDDIYWSKQMTEAWDYIKKHPKVSITIDVFHFGIVFFRKEQAKENFIIRT